MSIIPCPHCGADIREDAKFCRHCGSSEADGWSDEADYSSEDDFDYDEYVAENLSGGVTNTKTSPLWRFVAVVLLLIFLAWAFSAF